MILKSIPDQVFEIIGTIAGFSVSFFTALQIHAELSSDEPSTLSLTYVVGFLLVFFFWMLYGLRFRRIAIWLTNGVAMALQTVLLVVVMFR